MVNVVETKEIYVNFWSTLTVRDDLIAISYSNKVSGVNSKSKKKYSRFVHRYSTFVSFRGPRMRVWRKDAIRGFQDWTSETVRSWSDTYPPEMEKRGVELLTDGQASPSELIAREYPLAEYFEPRDGITPLLANRDLRVLSRKTFGATGKRRDVIRAVGELKSEVSARKASAALLVGKSLVGLVPAERMLDAMGAVSESKYRTLSYFHHREIATLRRVYRTMNQPSLLRLSRDGDGTRYLHDIAYYARHLEQNGVRVDLGAARVQDYAELFERLQRVGLDVV